MRARILLGLSALALAACASAADRAASSESEHTEGRPLTVIAGREWARCWFDAAADAATLSCTSTARGDDPLDAKVKVTAAGLNSPPGRGFEGYSKDLDIEAGSTVVVGTFKRTSFPVMLILDAALTPAASERIGDAQRIDFQSTPRIARAEDLTAANPAVLKQPFDLWPVAFLDGTDQQGRFFLAVQKYTTSIAPYESSFRGETEMTLEPFVVGAEARGKVHYLVAPSSGAIGATLHVAGGEVPTSIERPGYYTVTNTGLRPATPAEIAVDFPPGTTPEAGGGDPAADGGPSEPPPPPEPIDPDPTCGGAGQARCNGTSRDNGTRWDGRACVACGEAGQTYCYRDANNADDRSGRRCDDGTRWDSYGSKCVACGGAGQTYCYRDEHNHDDRSGRACDAGTRWDSYGSKCVPCGAVGQTYCYQDEHNYDDRSGRACDAGTRWDGSSGRCVACGAAGQTYCFVDADNYDDRSGRACGAGTRWDGSSSKCVACGAAGQTYCYADPRNYDDRSSRVCNPGLRYDASSQRCAP